MHHSSAIERRNARRFSPTILHSLERAGGYLGIVFHQKKLQVCWNDLSLIDQKAVIGIIRAGENRGCGFNWQYGIVGPS
jgi:hypothetical protein